MLEETEVKKMKYPLDEIIDKRTICQLKIERIEDREDRKRMIQEYEDYCFAISEYINSGHCSRSQVEEWHKKLYAVNAKGWDMESDIRAGKDEMTFEEIGKRAVKLREFNKERLKIKIDIVDKTGIGYKDIKINTK